MKKISTGLSRKSLAGQLIANQTIQPSPSIGRLSILSRIPRERELDQSNAEISLNFTDNTIRRLRKNEDSDNHASRSFRKHAQFKKESEYLSQRIVRKIDNRKKINLCKLHDEVVKTLESSINLKEVIFTKTYEEPDPDFKSNSLKKQIVFRKANTERNHNRNR